MVARHLRDIVASEKIDLTIANAENSAGGFGITPQLADELFGYGLDVLTSGNHIWDKREIYDYFARQPRLLRPANYVDELPGRGVVVVQARNGVDCAILNLQGRAYMPQTDCPFRKADALLECSSHPAVKVRFVDFHAELTSEKMAMGWYLDGRVSAVVGTHTHIPTADTRILPEWHRVSDRRGHDRPVSFRDRRGQEHRLAEIPHADAGADGSRPPWRRTALGDRRGGRIHRARDGCAAIHCVLTVAFAFEQARECVSREVRPLGDRQNRFRSLDSRGPRSRRVITADRDYPPFPPLGSRWVRRSRRRSARRAAVIGEVRAGEVFQGSAGAGEAVEIMTGAPLPAGADAVDDDRAYAHAKATASIPDRTLKPGDNFNPRGIEAHQGDTVLAFWQRLGFAEIAVLAMVGRAVRFRLSAAARCDSSDRRRNCRGR